MGALTEHVRKRFCDYKKPLTIILTIIYLLVIDYITCIGRLPSMLSDEIPYPFWSYVKAFSGDWKIAFEIIENIFLFIPFGYLLSLAGWKRKPIIIIGLTLSATIEITQLAYHLGLFEVDDILDNTIGTFLGIIIYHQLKLNDVRKILIAVAAVIFSFVFCFAFWNQKEGGTEKKFFFGIESSSIEKNTIILKGSCFLYALPEEEYSLTLKSEEHEIQLSMITDLPSEAVNTYYQCDSDYSRKGFVAAAEIDPEQTYEIAVKWNNGITTETSTYIKKGEVVYSPTKAPDYPGTLLVAEPLHDFCVYQKDGYLYWLCGPNFPFDNDGSTYIQYQLYTTQTSNLPAQRLANQWYWDNIGFNFEDYEIESYGIYRVAKYRIPTEYSITSIITGSYKNNEWVWKDVFRPVVYDLPGFPNVR